MKFSRRNFSRRKFVLTVGAAAGASMVPLGHLQGQASSNVLLMVFLRGGADGLQMLVPGSGHARAMYEERRNPAGTSGSIVIPPSSGSDPNRGIQLGSSRFDVNPAFAPLVSGAGNPFDAGHLGFVPGTAGARENRSHFQQMDLIETGTDVTGAVLGSGYLQRAIESMGLASAPLASLSLNAEIPLMLRGASSQGLAIANFDTFGQLGNEVFDAPANRGLTDRLRTAFSANPCTSLFCQGATKGIGAVEAVDALPTRSPGPGMAGALVELARLIAADTDDRFRVCTLDVGGWDTHTDQANRFRGGLEDLAAGLRAFYDEAVAQGIWGRVTVLCHSEFGRRVYENGTLGTDHGYGGVSLVMGTRVRRLSAAGFFPNTLNASHAFYSAIDADGVVPKVMDLRQLQAEALVYRLGLPPAQLATVFPGFTFDPAELVFRT